MMKVLPAVLALLTVDALAAPPKSAPAPRAVAEPVEKLAVIELDASDSLMGLAGQVTRAVVDAAKEQKVAVITPDEVRSQLSPEKHDELRKCHGGAACSSSLLDRLGATRAVLGTLGRDEKHYRLKLWLIDVKGVKVIADVDRSVLIAARRFQKDVEQAIPPLLRGEREARGTLKLVSTVDDTQVTVDGEVVGTAPVTVELRPGKYEVRAERKKYLPVTRLVAVEANQTTEEQLKMLLKPGEMTDAQEMLVMKGAAKKAEPTPEPGGPLRISVKTWLAGGLTVAASGAGLAFALLERSQENKLLDGYNKSTNVYAGTRSDALATQQMALFANIGWIVAGVAGATTVLFVVLDVLNSGEPEKPAVSLTPVLTPHGAGVAFGGRF